MRAKTNDKRETRCLVGSAPALVFLMISLVSHGTYAGKNTFKHHNADGSVIFSDAPVKNGQVLRTSYKAETRLPAVVNPCRGLSRSDLDARGRKLEPWFAQGELLHGVDANLLKAVARAESCFDTRAVSRAGAKGLMQLMPPTARAMDVADIFDAEQNLVGGARYLASMLARYSNNLELALAAYNAGPGNVDRYNGVPPFRETRRYIKSVKKYRERYQRMQATLAQAGTSE